ncbi:MAG: hypothetical protein R3A78_07580 [Polyangiales bacterium]|nr:hypothetical protein [Myxococcales bacterium]
MTKRSLPIATPESEGLGLRTIMDRELAKQFGARYVELAVFAIDLDRVRVEVETDDDDDPDWPFGWEVLLTEFALAECAADDDAVEFLDLVCASVFERALEGPSLGGQLAFAIYAATAHGTLPETLRASFLHWKKKPVELLAAVDALRADENAVSELARACLEVPLEPPLAPPTQRRLERLSVG